MARETLLQGGLMEMLWGGFGVVGGSTVADAEIVEQNRMVMDAQFPFTLSIYIMGHTTRSVISYCTVENLATGQQGRRPVRATISEYSAFDVKEAPLFSIAPLQYTMQGSDLRYLKEYLQQTDWDAMRVTVHTRDLGGMPVDVGNSNPIRTADMRGMMRDGREGATIPCNGGSLILGFGHSARQPGEGENIAHAFVGQLSNIVWVADAGTVMTALGTGGGVAAGE